MLIFVVWTGMLHSLGQKTNKCCHHHSHLRFRGESIFIEVVISTADYPIVVILHRGIEPRAPTSLMFGALSRDRSPRKTTMHARHTRFGDYSLRSMLPESPSAMRQMRLLVK
jgi:hypothetical protein